MKKYFFTLMGIGVIMGCMAQVNPRNGDPKMTEQWIPEPRIVTPGETAANAPSDAIVLFDGKNTNAWASKTNGPVAWKVADGILTVAAGSGEIHTKDGFGSCQLHIEWRTPAEVKGDGQGRGNSGIFLMGR